MLSLDFSYLILIIEGEGGFEPPPEASQTPMLLLHYSPFYKVIESTHLRILIYYMKQVEFKVKEIEESDRQEFKYFNIYSIRYIGHPDL